MATTIGTARVEGRVGAGAQLLDVLPRSEFDEEHLPGAINIPLPELDRVAASRFDRGRAVIVYCYDLQCDLSSRGAALLEAHGHPEVYDYGESKVAWFSFGKPAEGTVADAERAGHLARPASTCAPSTPLVQLPDPGPGGVVLVVDEAGVVLGELEPERVSGAGVDATALSVAAPGPTSVRPSITASELARSMDRAGEGHVIVSTLAGVLIGVLERADLDAVDR